MKPGSSAWSYCYEQALKDTSKKLKKKKEWNRASAGGEGNQQRGSQQLSQGGHWEPSLSFAQSLNFVVFTFEITS